MHAPTEIPIDSLVSHCSTGNVSVSGVTDTQSDLQVMTPPISNSLGQSTMMCYKSVMGHNGS